MLLTVMMLLSCVPLGVFASAAETSYNVGDIVEFGSYPQSEVTDTTVKAALTAAAGSTDGWTSYNYYINSKQSDYMKYTDVEYDGAKYRGVYFTQYRPYYTGNPSSTGNSYQDDNGYSTSTIYWFKYEPMKWQVLSYDSTTGEAVVLSKNIIDSQQYYYTDSGTRTINGETVYTNNYEHSDIRTWLNNTFYNTAFGTSEKNAIVATTLDNSAYSTSYSEYDSNSTTDNVWLLSYSEAQNTAYGFTSDTNSTETRQSTGTAYALCQGLWKRTSNGCSLWRLRSAGSSNYGACDVVDDGWVSNYYDVSNSDDGVRPALTLNLTSEISPSCEHSWQTTVTSPTCTERGYTNYHCTKCSRDYNDNFTDALGHDFTKKSIDEEHLVSAATCTTPAIYKYDCSRCSETGGTFENGDALGHDFTEKIIDEEHLASDKTATSPAKYYYDCIRCDTIGTETFEYGEPGECEHEFGPITIIDDGEVAVRSSIDVVFVVDTTGSMGDDISRVKSDINTYLNTLQSNAIDYRVALVDYRDFASRTGSKNDYAYNVCLDFTNDAKSIRSAVSALSLGYGGDASETVYSALVDGLKSLSWRDDAGKAAIVMGDAGALDPEPFTGYTLSSTAEVLKNDFSSPVAVFGIATGSSALSSFQKIAEATGGKAYSAANSLDITSLVKSIIKILPTVVVIPGAEWQIRTPATCTAAGVEFRVCVKCKVYEETRIIEPLGHSYAVTGSEATCTEDGHLVYTCTRCGDTYEEFPKAYGHLFNAADVKYYEATCTEDAYSESTCARCGMESRVDYPDTALGHDMDSGVVVGSGDCTYKKVRFSCRRDGCGYYYDEEDGYLKHDGLTLVSSVDPTCTEKGVYEWYCSECEKTVKEEIDALGHDFVYTDNGDGQTHTAECSRCGYTVVENHKGRKCICGYVRTGDYGVLLVEDTLPWSTSTNEKVLNDLVEAGAITFYDKSSTNSLSKTDFSGYSVILIANDQSTASYNRLEEVKSALDSYVYDGGVVIFGACDNGWKGGNISFKLPGGVSKLFKLDYYNKIADSTHPVVTAELSDRIPLTDSDLHSTYCSHTYFDSDSFVDGTNVIFTDSEGNATLIEYAYGTGTVLASGLTWEYSAVYRDYAQFSPKGYDDLILYALGNSIDLSNKVLVRFFGFDNELLSAQYIDKGGDAAAPEAPETEGYDFTGWLGTYTNVTAATDVYAQYTPRKYTVSLESAEDGVVLKGAGEYDYGTFAVIEAGSVDGKTFAGWFEGAEKVSDNMSFGYKVTGDAVLTAQYEDIASHTHSYTLTYTRAATCFSKGLSIYSCVCGDAYSEYTDKLEHVKAVKTTAANCIDAEMTIEYCTVCNTVLSQTETAPALDHDLEYVSITPSTCIEYGYEKYKCKRCNIEFKKYLSELAEHTEGEPVTVDATCVTPGSVTVSCTVCRKRLSYTEIPCTGTHTFGEWTVTKEPTCATDGVNSRTCSVCGFTETKSIEKSDSHTGRTYTSVIKQATCSEKGTLGTYCLDCRALLSEEDIPVGEHIFGDWKTVKEATCTETGTQERKCEACGYTEQRTVDKNDNHTSSRYTKVIKQATCTEKGILGTYCYGCNALLSKEDIPAGGHKFGEWTVTKEATCTEEGAKERKCANCTYTETQTIAKNEHKLGEWTVTKEATCTEEGEEERKCANCTYTETQTIAKTGHKFGEWTVTKEATCTEEGAKERKCANCTYTETQTIAKAPHKPGEWIETKVATCTEKGEKIRKCTVCGETVAKQSISAHGHTDADHDGKCDNCQESTTGDCNHICHSKNKLAKFFWKIIRALQKLFRTRQYCDCGVKHW